MGPGGQKHWISCSAMKHFEIMTITQLCFPLCRAKSSHGPHEHRTLSWVFQCKQPLPSQSIPMVDLQGPEERRAEKQPRSHQPRSQESRAGWDPQKHDQKEITDSCSLYTPRDVREHFISQHLSPGPCAQTTALPVPLPRESPVGFSFHFHPHPSWPEDNPHPRTGSKTGCAGCQGVLLD